MFNYDEFLAKTKLYFDRASLWSEDPEQSSLWLLLGLEFLLRAPLAKIHPTLLALPEGDSILHAAGIEQPTGLIRSIPMKTVLLRLGKIDPGFGQDRGKDALWLTDLRNQELHSSMAALANIPRSVWMPRFLNVLEAVCAYLGIETTSMLDEEIRQEAEAYRATADKAVLARVNKILATARSFFEGLTEEEVATRIAAPSPIPDARRIKCPACSTSSAWIETSEGRTTQPRYDEDNAEIQYKVISVAIGLRCTVCNLRLGSTAEVIAAGVDRLVIQEYSEDRYEGWEELMTYEDALKMLAEGEEYMNE